MSKVDNYYILLPIAQYNQMKNLIKELNICLDRVAFSCNRSIIKQIFENWNQSIKRLQILHKQIGAQFQDGKINKKTLTAQIQSLNQNVKNLKQTLAAKQRQGVKFSSELMKISQQNQRLREYIRKTKEEQKGYKTQMQNMVQSLSAKVRKYKQQFEQKANSYEAKIKYLEQKVGKLDQEQDDLDNQLIQLAKLQQQMDSKIQYSEQDQQY